MTARYEKYAKAQAWLTDSALYIPTTTYNGAFAVVSRIKPFSGAYAPAGDKGSTYPTSSILNLKMIIVTKNNTIQLIKIGLKKERNLMTKLQKDLAKHVINLSKTSAFR